MNYILNIIIIFISIIFTLAIVFFIWANITYKPTPLAILSMLSDNSVTVTKNNFIVFTPNNSIPSKGFVFYPGAKVKPESYAPLCKKISKEGFLVIIAPMTLNLAVFSPNKAKNIINNFNNIDTWIIGGHSLGGAMASNYALKDSKIKGIVFYGSYPSKNKLKGSDKQILSIYGSLDGIASLKNIKDSPPPENSKFIEIKGGNHAQFGSYGNQAGDNKAKISNEYQIDLASRYTVEFLNNVDELIEIHTNL